MRLLLFVCLCFAFPGFVFGQSVLRGIVKNADTKEPLSFATVALKNSQRGVITNEEGVFRISIENKQDSLVISYLGFQTKVLSIKSVQQLSIILLSPSDYNLSEIVVRPGDEYLYKIVAGCRAHLKSVPTYSAKTFMEVNTNQREQPMELVQCYFNGQYKGGIVEDLKLKTGRVGLARYKNNFFVSLGTSQAITRLNLLDKNSSFPENPLQFKKRKLRKRYRLEEIPSLSNDELIHIRFTPKSKAETSFAGELWIDRKTNALLNIKCKIENAKVHPFELIRDVDEMDQFKLELSQTFQLVEDQHRLTHFNFNYNIRYFSVKEQGATKEISTKGLLFVYDYEKPFILPFYDYAPEHHDYRKISFLPYQSFFWTRENPLELTKEQQAWLDYFWEKGELINFQKSFFKPKKDRGFFRPTNLYWSKERRISLKRHIPPGQELGDAEMEGLFRGEKYKLSVQLFLDINEVGDSIIHLSKSVLDIFQTHFYLEQTPLMNCFVNIYFDLCEIERLKMEEKLSKADFTIDQIKAIYEQSKVDMETVTQQYLQEVQTGTNTVKLEEWNAIVQAELGINNMELFGLLPNE